MKIDDIRYALAKQVRAIAYGVTLHCDYGDLRLEGHDAEKVAALVQKLLTAQLQKAEQREAQRKAAYKPR
jgi:hypothetical protein